MATIGSNRRFSIESKNPSFPSVAFLWPALAAEQAREFAAAIAKEFAKLAGGSEPQQPGVEPEWTTREGGRQGGCKLPGRVGLQHRLRRLPSRWVMSGDSLSS